MGGGFNYNGEGATGTGLDRDPYVRDSNGNAIGVKSGYHAESYGTSSPALGPNGAIQITAGVILCLEISPDLTVVVVVGILLTPDRQDSSW